MELCGVFSEEYMDPGEGRPYVMGWMLLQTCSPERGTGTVGSYLEGEVQSEGGLVGDVLEDNCMGFKPWILHNLHWIHTGCVPLRIIAAYVRLVVLDSSFVLCCSWLGGRDPRVLFSFRAHPGSLSRERVLQILRINFAASAVLHRHTSLRLGS